MKRPLLYGTTSGSGLVVAGTCLIAATYGLVRLAYGLFLPDISASLGLDQVVAGRISSGASLAYCVGAVCGLVWSQHPRALVAGALVTASVGSLAMARAPDVTLFAPATVLASMGAGLASPGLVGLVQRHVATDRSARAQAVVNSGTGPGLVAAGAMALVLLPDWRLGFALSAAGTVVAGSAVLLLDSRGDGPPARVAAAAGVPAPSPAWWRALLLPAVAALLLGSASAVVWTYGRSQLVAAGAGVAASTAAWMAVGVGGILTVLTARALGRLGPPRAWLVTTTAVAGATACLGLVPGQLLAGVVAGTVFGWAFVAASSALIAWAEQVDPQRAAAGTAVLFVTLVLGQGLGSAVAGVVADRHGLPAAFWVAAVVAVGAAACGLRTSRQPRGGPSGTHP